LNSFYITGGPLPLEASSYVVRQADTDLYESLLAGEYCCVLSGREMGKSSLAARTCARLQKEGVRTVFLDLAQFGGGADAATREAWCLALLTQAGRDLGLYTEFLAYWQARPEFSPEQRFFGALLQPGLDAAPAPLTVFLDAVDAVTILPFDTDAFFAAVGKCHLGRAGEPTLDRLAFCLLGSEHPAASASGTRTSSFSLGRRVDLRNFTAEEAAPLAQGLGAHGDILLPRILHWTGGHPCLTQRLCRACAENEAGTAAEVDSLWTAAFVTQTVMGNGSRLAQKQALPRQRRTFRRGLLPTVAVLLIAAGLAGRALHNVFLADRKADLTRAAAGRASREKEKAGLGLYAANMSLIERDWKNNDIGHLREMLEATRARGLGTFEWGFWNRLCHLDLLTIQGQNEGIWSVAFSPDQRSIVTGSQDQTATVWDAASGRELFLLSGHTASVRSVAFSPDGKRIATGSLDHTAKLWDAQSGTEILTLKGHSGPIASVAFSADSQRIGTASSDRSAQIWDVGTGAVLLTLKGHTRDVNSIAFSPDGKRIVTGSSDKTAAVWDAVTGRTLLTLKGHTDAVCSAAFSPDGTKIVTGSRDRSAKLWDARTGKELRTLGGHSGVVCAASFSPDGSRLVTVGATNSAKVWDAADGRELFTLNGHTRPVTSAVFSADGTRILTGSTDGAAKVWDAQARSPPSLSLRTASVW